MLRLSLADRVARARDLLFAEIDGEAVALNASRGICYGLNSVGLRVLQLIEAPVPIADVCHRLAVEFEVDDDQCQREVIALLHDLAAEELVVVSA